jgi:hypothetical protein
MRHRSFITALTLLVVLMIISCSLGARLPTPTATTPPAAPFDSDGDRVPDADDNCPITPNPDQADADANGLGDPCDAPFLDGFAYLTPQGVVQSSVDERLRPAKIVAPDGTITFVWSEDASRVDLIVEAAGESKTFTLEIDLSDAALLAALDAAEAETGQDLSALRAWIAENPGRVLAVARGEQPPPRLAPTPGSSLPAGKVLLAIPKKPAAQEQQTDAEDYIDSLIIYLAIARTALYDFDEQHPFSQIGGHEWAYYTARDLLANQVLNRQFFLLYMENNCLSNCNARCPVDCSSYSNKGACYPNFPNPPCYEYLGADCDMIQGAVYHRGQACPSACWAFAPGWTEPQCFWIDKPTCEDLARSVERGGHVNRTVWCGTGRTCDEPICSQPVP